MKKHIGLIIGVITCMLLSGVFSCKKSTTTPVAPIPPPVIMKPFDFRDSMVGVYACIQYNYSGPTTTSAPDTIGLVKVGVSDTIMLNATTETLSYRDSTMAQFTWGPDYSTIFYYKSDSIYYSVHYTNCCGMVILGHKIH